jgi:hypothetical protein
MRALFDVGFVEGRAGYRWLSAPPEIGGEDEESDGSDRF